MIKADREKFGLPGLNETYSKEMLEACIEKQYEKVKALKNFVNMDVCDNRGYSPIIIAIVKFHILDFNYKIL